MTRQEHAMMLTTFQHLVEYHTRERDLLEKDEQHLFRDTEEWFAARREADYHDFWIETLTRIARIGAAQA